MKSKSEKSWGNLDQKEMEEEREEQQNEEGTGAPLRYHLLRGERPQNLHSRQVSGFCLRYSVHGRQPYAQTPLYNSTHISSLSHTIHFLSATFHRSFPRQHPYILNGRLFLCPASPLGVILFRILTDNVRGLSGYCPFTHTHTHTP